MAQKKVTYRVELEEKEFNATFTAYEYHDPDTYGNGCSIGIYRNNSDTCFAYLDVRYEKYDFKSKVFNYLKMYFGDNLLKIEEIEEKTMYKVAFKYTNGGKGVCKEAGEIRLFDTEQAAAAFAADLNSRIEEDMKQFFPVWYVEKA